MALGNAVKTDEGRWFSSRFRQVEDIGGQGRFW